MALNKPDNRVLLQDNFDKDPHSASPYDYGDNDVKGLQLAIESDKVKAIEEENRKKAEI